MSFMILRCMCHGNADAMLAFAWTAINMAEFMMQAANETELAWLWLPTLSLRLLFYDIRLSAKVCDAWT